MTNEKRRQSVLLALLGGVLMVYLNYSGVVSFGGGELGSSALPPIDATSLQRALESVSTVDPGLVVAPLPESVPDRNLFQYGVAKPPPPDPEELERQRLEAQRALELAEERARRDREQQELLRQQQRDAAARAAEQAKENENLPPRTPPPPPKPVPPAISFRFVGVFGPVTNKIGVFLEGDTPPLLAKEGQVIREQFRILEIGVEWADVGYVDPVFKDQRKRISLGS